MEIHILHIRQSFLVRLAIGRKFSFGIKQINRYLVTLFRQQSGDCQCISTIIARSGKYRNRCFSLPAFHNRFCQCLRGTLHQVDGSNRFIFYCVSIQLFDALSRKYLHIFIFKLLTKVGYFVEIRKEGWQRIILKPVGGIKASSTNCPTCTSKCMPNARNKAIHKK